MPNYRRIYLPGGIYFFTLVTYCRRPLFKDPANVELLRAATAQIKAKKPFEILAAVVLPDHIHFVWQLPPNDSDYSQRISRLKVLFTRAFKANYPLSNQVSASRLKHRESDVWQRRFWEHTIKEEAALHQYLDLPPLSQCSDCNYIEKSLFLNKPCPNCGSCSVPRLVHHGKFTQLLNEACNFQLNEKYELAFDKAFELTQLIEQAIPEQFQNTGVFPTKWKNIQNITHQKYQGYLLQEKDSEEAIKVAKDALKSYVNENNKSCSKNKNG